MSSQVEDLRTENLIASFEDLTGQPAPLLLVTAGENSATVAGRPTPVVIVTALRRALDLLESDPRGLGYSQFNELLLLLGYDRITEEFFQYLISGTMEYEPESAIGSLDQFQDGITRFRKHALQLFGNVKYAFKNLSRDAEVLGFWLNFLAPLNVNRFTQRHEPVQKIEPISGADAFYLGYLVQREIQNRIQNDPDDQEARNSEERRKTIVEIGKRNHQAYLASDHLDVYIATSMREKHEYLLVSDWTQAIFRHEEVAHLKLRWFDPTQAYCQDRIDKGLSEALMLKRAICTVYFVQETDTLGKDSELASTLAQGKPVIAFVPRADSDYIDNLLRNLHTLYPEKSEKTLLLEQLQVFDPGSAWKDSEVRQWLDPESTPDLQVLKKRLAESIKRHYDKRAEMLSRDHPLGIQVNLTTGVANGVLVVRTIQQCAELIRRVVTQELEFDLTLDVKETGKQKYVFLRERVSSCIFRVMTGDAMLTNAFWNFYLDPAD